MKIKQNKPAGFLIIGVVYIAAAVLGIWMYGAHAGQHVFIRILAADISATLLVFLAGLLLKNASVYDPYWSVAPIVIFFGLGIEWHAFYGGNLLLLLAVAYWGVRLTCNWAYTFRDLNTQDWRYDMFQRKFPRLFPLVSLFGIHLVPTIVVYAAILPAVVFMQNSAINALTVLGALICIASATLQWIADVQMHRFRKAHPDRQQFIRSGLWTHARHPNYLGEIMMWWGIYVIMLSASPDFWYLGAGACLNTALFLFISIPLADKRNAGERPGFAVYKKETRSLLPIPKKVSADVKTGQTWGG